MFCFEMISKIVQNYIETATWFNWFSLFPIRLPESKRNVFKVTHETDGSVQLWHIER